MAGVIELTTASELIIDMPSVSPNLQKPLNLPSRDLLSDKFERNERSYRMICLPLYKASINGNLEVVQGIIKERPELVRLSITESDETVLHIAVMGNSLPVVSYLIKKMRTEDFELQNRKGETCLHIAAITGNNNVAELLVSANQTLPDIPDSDGKTPLYRAALNRNYEMVKYLLKKCPNTTHGIWTVDNRSCILEKCVEANLFDVALEMVENCLELATNAHVLRLLARKPDAFRITRPSLLVRLLCSIRHPKTVIPGTESPALCLLKIILNEIGKLPKAEFEDILRGPPDETKVNEKQIPYEKESQEVLHLLRTISENVSRLPATIFSLFKSPCADEQQAVASKDAKNKYSSRVLFVAAEIGNTGFLKEFIQQYPHLCKEVDENGQSIFHVAVSHGHEDIYKLLFDVGSISNTIISLEDKKGNNMLHLVGDKIKGNTVQNVRGVGLRLNPEIFWFQDIKQKIPPHLHEKKNLAGLTPQEAFIKNHKDLFSKGEEWMKEIASQIMVVAALLATISYAGLITIPSPKTPFYFLEYIAIHIFLTSVSVSFICSATSIIMVMSILGSNYDGYDFMLSLSNQLMICLLSVSVSIVTLILSFLMCAILVFPVFYNWIPLIITSSVCIIFMKFAFTDRLILGPYMGKFRKMSG